MINYFLQQEPQISPEVKNLIRKKVSNRRQYQPFHIDCHVTKRKICYCVNNPVINISIDSHYKQKMWSKYEQADNFYLGVDPQKKKQAEEHHDLIKTKIQSLSRREVVDFVKSIKKEKNLMGEIIEY